MVKQVTRVNVNILGIRKLNWTGMGEFNSEIWRSSIQFSKKKKKDWELTISQIMNSLLPNSDLN